MRKILALCVVTMFAMVSFSADPAKPAIGLNPSNGSIIQIGSASTTKPVEMSVVLPEVLRRELAGFTVVSSPDQKNTTKMALMTKDAQPYLAKVKEAFKTNSVSVGKAHVRVLRREKDTVDLSFEIPVELKSIQGTDGTVANILVTSYAIQTMKVADTAAFTEDMNVEYCLTDAVSLWKGKKKEDAVPTSHLVLKAKILKVQPEPALKKGQIGIPPRMLSDKIKSVPVWDPNKTVRFIYDSDTEKMAKEATLIDSYMKQGGKIFAAADSMDLIAERPEEILAHEAKFEGCIVNIRAFMEMDDGYLSLNLNTLPMHLNTGEVTADNWMFEALIKDGKLWILRVQPTKGQSVTPRSIKVTEADTQPYNPASQPANQGQPNYTGIGTGGNF